MRDAAGIHAELSAAAAATQQTPDAEPRGADDDLRHDNYDTVLSLLKESDDTRKLERARTEEKERDAMEKATLVELALAEERAKVLDLRKKLRRLESTSVCFAPYCSSVWMFVLALFNMLAHNALARSPVWAGALKRVRAV